MDGEVVDPLFTLLYNGITIYVPIEFFSLAVDLLQSLVNWYSSYRYWGVPYYGFSCLMDARSCGEVHHGIGTIS
jgi:hypothetical protein